MFLRHSTVKKLAPTPAIEEGPYYKEGSPARRNLIDPDMPGTRLFLEGHVRDTNGKPIANAWIDFWQADSTGQYDNVGYKLRGHQYTEKDGKYRLDTIVPAGYESRAPHLHVKIRPKEDSPVFTTQLFFAGNELNATDFLYDELAALETRRTRDGLKAQFDFIVDVG